MCSHCKIYLGELCRVKLLNNICVNCGHTFDISKKKGIQFFLIFPLKNKFQQLISNNLDNILDPRMVNNSNEIKDIFDGEIYKKLVSNNVLTTKTLTLTLNTDGLNIFHSRRYASLGRFLCILMNSPWMYVISSKM